MLLIGSVQWWYASIYALQACYTKHWISTLQKSITLVKRHEPSVNVWETEFTNHNLSANQTWLKQKSFLVQVMLVYMHTSAPKRMIPNFGDAFPTSEPADKRVHVVMRRRGLRFWSPNRKWLQTEKTHQTHAAPFLNRCVMLMLPLPLPPMRAKKLAQTNFC